MEEEEEEGEEGREQPLKRHAALGQGPGGLGRGTATMTDEVEIVWSVVSPLHLCSPLQDLCLRIHYVDS
jgi:hypothetical protein